MRDFIVIDYKDEYKSAIPMSIVTGIRLKKDGNKKTRYMIVETNLFHRTFGYEFDTEEDALEMFYKVINGS